LRSSPSTRRAYAGLLTELWSVLAPDWQRAGRAAVAAAVAGRSELQRKGAPWQEVGQRFCSEDLLNNLVASLGSDGTLAVVPAYFAHLGLLADLPGSVVLGVKAAPPGHEVRAHVDALARHLKALSDPTRLALVQALRWDRMTVTELARAFSLAQPTVSTAPAP
jgi:hypothetical protein